MGGAGAGDCPKDSSLYRPEDLRRCRAAKTPVAGIGVELPSQAVRLKNTVVVQLGKDFLLESEVDGNVYGDC